MRISEQNYIPFHKIKTGGRCEEKIERGENQEKHCESQEECFQIGSQYYVMLVRGADEVGGLINT